MAPTVIDAALVAPASLLVVREVELISVLSSAASLLGEVASSGIGSVLLEVCWGTINDERDSIETGLVDSSAWVKLASVVRRAVAAPELDSVVVVMVFWEVVETGGRCPTATVSASSSGPVTASNVSQVFSSAEKLNAMQVG